jgi:hypothetical protein
MPRQTSQPGKSEANDVRSSWGLKNMPRNGLEFQRHTQGCASSQLTAAWSGVLAITVMAAESSSACDWPSALV